MLWHSVSRFIIGKCIWGNMHFINKQKIAMAPKPMAIDSIGIVNFDGWFGGHKKNSG